jgi:hypothetical protein
VIGRGLVKIDLGGSREQRNDFMEHIQKLLLQLRARGSPAGARAGAARTGPARRGRAMIPTWPLARREQPQAAPATCTIGSTSQDEDEEAD